MEGLGKVLNSKNQCQTSKKKTIQTGQKKSCDQAREYYKKWQKNKTSAWKVPCENFEDSFFKVWYLLLLANKINPQQENV